MKSEKKEKIVDAQDEGYKSRTSKIQKLLNPFNAIGYKIGHQYRLSYYLQKTKWYPWTEPLMGCTDPLPPFVCPIEHPGAIGNTGEYDPLDADCMPEKSCDTICQFDG